MNKGMFRFSNRRNDAVGGVGELGKQGDLEDCGGVLRTQRGPTATIMI